MNRFASMLLLSVVLAAVATGMIFEMREPRSWKNLRLTMTFAQVCKVVGKAPGGIPDSGHITTYCLWHKSLLVQHQLVLAFGPDGRLSNGRKRTSLGPLTIGGERAVASSEH